MWKWINEQQKEHYWQQEVKFLFPCKNLTNNLKVTKNEIYTLSLQARGRRNVFILKSVECYTKNLNIYY